ncbi:MAG: trigger factor [Flavobacteriales bacterium]|nr:trigger factor [Flavobacteriales bacterium]MDG1779658.1 trigger factor [Flavobacteriales bacterium]MDG2246424.1 trigger factor [Flavobacteriales bacterium]
MDIKRTKIDDLTAKLSLTLSKEDYFDKYETSLKNYKKQVNLPGFRPGKVPMSLVKRQFGKSILAEELNKVINDGMYEHIMKEKLNILGNPIPAENDDVQGDWDNPDTFTFEYEIGLAPTLEVEKAMKKAPVKYKVKVDKKMIDKHVEELAKRHGSVDDVEKSEDNDLLLGTFIELTKDGEIKEGGFMNDGTLHLETVEDKKTKKALTGLVKEAELNLNPDKIAKSHDELGKMLGITHDQVHNMEGDVKFRVNEIKRLTAHEVNQELYDKVFGKDEVKDEKEFEEKLTGELDKMFDRDATNLFKRQFSESILDNLDAPLPDEFLKRWIQLSNEKPISEEQLNEEYPGYSRHLRWQLVEGKVMEEHKLEITEDEVRSQAKGMIGAQYAQYGMPLDEEMLENFANNVLADKKERQRIIEVLQENKVLDTLTAQVKLKEKEVSYDDFLEIAGAGQN